MGDNQQELYGSMDCAELEAMGLWDTRDCCSSCHDNYADFLRMEPYTPLLV